MDTKALRQKILDLAIRGKLVPQDPNDEPASVLLERIREQKKQMVKEGKLKAKDIKNDSIIFVDEDNLHYEKFADGTVKCIEEEIPFELPEGWSWSNLGILTDVYGRIGFRGYTKNDLVEKGKGAITLSPSNIIDNRMDYSACTYISWKKYDESPEIMIHDNDILLVKTGSSYGKSAFVENLPEKATINPQFVVLKETRINPRFLCYFLQSNYAKTKFDELVVGTAIPTFSQANLNAMYIAFPGLKEQEKIVEKISELLSYVDIISEEKESLHSVIQQTKSKILDLAIRGQLVPQNPNDEPASVLLERIRAEKEDLINQGKIKRDKKESIIFKGEDNSYYEKIGNEVRCIDEEIPFELPKGWNWVRLKTICSKIIDGSHNPPKGLDEKTPYIMASSRNICFDMITDLENIRYLNDKDFEKENARSQLTINDILLTTVATLGRSCIYDGFPENLCFQRSVTVITTSIFPQYLKIFFDAPYFQDFIINNATGTAQKGFYLNQLEGVLVCIPPADEQERLSAKIQQLLSNIQYIEKSLS